MDHHPRVQSVMALSSLVWAGLAALVLGLSGIAYLSIVLAWEDQHTRGVAYFGRPAAERERFRRHLRAHARLLFPVMRLAAHFSRVTMAKASFPFEGIAGPKGNCTPESFATGRAYKPRSEDVFVVTQMKSGTTWMQHLVYQVLTRGQGDLAESRRALYSVSPWLEGIRSVRVEDAPLVGQERPSRIIKTHFPAGVCPFSRDALYVYVARHPVSCYASCTDFIGENLGAFAPGQDEICRWFCSDEAMWWGSWPRHVEGWWKLAAREDNVIFVYFEEMKGNLEGVARRLVSLLGITPLNEDELTDVVYKCGFEYMKEHASSFEMHPPHLLAVDAELFVRGTAERYRDVPADVREQVMTWCRERLAGSEFPMDREYPPG